MKNKLLTILFLIIIGCFMFAYILFPENLVSKSERRKLMTLNELKDYSFFDVNFSDKLEKYALDQVWLREPLRTIKSKVMFDVLRQGDSHGVYYEKNHWFKQDSEYDEKQVNRFIDKINEISAAYPTSTTYTILIPDKSYYLKSNHVFRYDYDMLKRELINKLDSKWISVEGQLSLNDYYKTDPHLKQNSWLKLQRLIEEGMKIPIFNTSYQKHSYKPFYGAYSGQASYNKDYDVLDYYSNQVIERASVKHMDHKEITKVYDKEMLKHLDSYDIFLAGPTSFVEIENKESENDKVLLVVRDSYGSSLTPLMIEQYKKIYVLDLRYIRFSDAKKLITDNVDDIMYVYGAISVNQSNNLR